jgi:hypothetical protein
MMSNVNWQGAAAIGVFVGNASSLLCVVEVESMCKGVAHRKGFGT